MAEQWNSDGGTVEQCRWKSVVEQWNNVGGDTVEQ